MGITAAGLKAVAGLILSDVAVDGFDWLAIGTGTTPFDKAQTALVAETHREAGTGTRTTTTETDDTAQLVATFGGYSGAEAITEIGMFNAASGGDMLMRQVFDPLNVNWSAGDSIEVTVRIQVS